MKKILVAVFVLAAQWSYAAGPGDVGSATSGLSDVEEMVLMMAKANIGGDLRQCLVVDTKKTRDIKVSAHGDALIEVQVKGCDNGQATVRIYRVKQSAPGIIESVILQSVIGPVGP